MMKYVSPTLTLLIASTAHAAPIEARTSPTLEVSVALVEPRGAERRTVFEAMGQLTDAHGCVKVAARAATVEHEISICREGGTDDRPGLSVSVNRMLRGEGVDDRREARMSAAIAPGKKVVIGKVATTASTLEIEARVDVAR